MALKPCLQLLTVSLGAPWGPGCQEGTRGHALLTSASCRSGRLLIRSPGKVTIACGLP